MACAIWNESTNPQQMIKIQMNSTQTDADHQHHITVLKDVNENDSFLH